jgi:hypothetical protein
LLNLCLISFRSKRPLGLVTPTHLSMRSGVAEGGLVSPLFKRHAYTLPPRGANTV